MSFNNGLERKKFENTWKKLRMEYAAAGMSKADIEEMYQFDLDMFRSERRYAEHTQGMPFQKFDDDGDTAGAGELRTADEVLRRACGDAQGIG